MNPESPAAASAPTTASLASAAELRQTPRVRDPAGTGSRTTSAHAVLLLLVVFAVLMVGLQRSLPLFFDVDEDVFANAAARIAASGDLDPGFYGTPGASTIYPLAAGYRLWFAFTQQGQLLRADPNFPPHFQQATLEYYWLGRWLSVAYALVSVALTVVIGRRAFGRSDTGAREFGAYVGIGAGWLVAFHGIAVYNAKQVRTDSAAAAFGLLAVWCLLRLLDSPHLTRQLLAGAAVGLAAASRYYMAVLAAVLALADALLLWKSSERRKLLLPMAAGFAMIPLVFLAANPAMLPNWQAVVSGLRAETVAEHLGGDGLGPGGNLWWYLNTALPGAITWVQLLAAVIGVPLAWRHSRAATALLAASLLLLVVGVSLSPRHFARYMIQALPLLALFASVTVATGARALVASRSWPARMQTWLFAAGIFVLLAVPVARVVRLDIQHANGDTRLLARTWLLENGTRDDRILQEEYGAPLANSGLQSETIRSLPDITNLATARAAYAYWVASSEIYLRYYAEPTRYAEQIAFYDQLFTSGAQVAEFPAVWYRNGPTIRVFRTDLLSDDLFAPP